MSLYGGRHVKQHVRDNHLGQELKYWKAQEGEAMEEGTEAEP